MSYRPGYDPRPAQIPGLIPYSCRDVQEGLGDFFRLQTGARVENPYPVAEFMASEGVGMDRLARHWLAPHMDVDYLRGAPKAEVITRAMGSSDFVSALTSGWHDVVSTTFNERISGFRQLLRDWPVRDFRPQYIPNFGGISDLQALTEHGEYTYGVLAPSSVLEDVSITTRGLAFTVSRQALINDAAQEITAAMMALGNAAALSLANAVATALQDTSNLDDGTPMFDATKSNYLAAGSGGGEPSMTTLDAAAALLWRMPVGDLIAGCAPRFIVTAPERAYTAKVLSVATFDPAGSAGTVPQGRFDNVILPHLTDVNDWYLMPDPAAAPVLALLRLSGSSSLVYLEQINTPIGRDGIAFKLRTDFAIARVSRFAVKVQAS